RVLVGGAMLLAYGLALKYFPVPGSATSILSESVNWPAHMNNTFFGPFNLEGILSAIPTGALVIIGTIFGDSLLAPATGVQRMKLLCLSGLALIASGMIWSLSLPYSKALWTPTYI